jgi:2'-5' RNA ligase
MRAFIALEVPEGIKQRVEDLENDFRMEGLTLVKKEAMHVTLQFLGEIDAGQAEKVVESMKKVRLLPFKVNFSGLSYFTPRLIRVIFAEISQGEKEIRDLYGKLGSELTSSGITFEAERDYKPHLTIARVKRVKDMRRLRDSLEKNSRVELGSFEARSVVLKESTLTPAGPLYRSLYELNF